MHEVNERWIQWWCAPWQWAHPGWIERFVQNCGWPVTDLEQQLRGRHSAFLHSVGIAASQPPEPSASLVQWLLLSAGQQIQALQLVESICLGQGAQPMEEPAYEPWCRAVAKALRPGLWLDPALRDPRLLLAAWTGEACWSRLRLSWAPDEVAQAAVELPANRFHTLCTLWQAVLWRVTTA